MNLREAYAATALASLEWDDNKERAVDRVAAAGRADRLSLQIWKAKYLLEAKAYQDARKGLIKHFTQRYRAELPLIAEKCVDEALSEFLGPSCEACNGARELVAGNLRVVCESCNGSGLKRYSDMDRARRMQMSLQRVRSLGHKLKWLANELGTLDRSVNMVMAVELERA